MSDSFYSREPFSFGRNDEIFDGIKVTRADRGPCPVCGHPTGDCAPGENSHIKIAFGEQKIESLKENQLVLVEEDVFVERQITPYTTTRIRVARKGQQIPIEKARQLGIIKN